MGPVSGFVRPEARAALWRWREVLAGAGAVALGAYWVLGPGQLLGWLGWLLIALGGALAFIGTQRARFRSGTGGPGVVVVDEGEITYLGPLSGGSVAIADLERLTLNQAVRPALWVLDRPAEAPLNIPVNAEGADRLFDAFTTLPGLRTERMLGELNGPGRHPVVIWERRPMRPPLQQLH